MFLERLIFFLIMGFFVFSPKVPGWWDDPSTWYLNYIPWMLLAAACAWLHFHNHREEKSSGGTQDDPGREHADL